MFNFLFKNFIRVWILGFAWKTAVWFINRRYKGTLVSKLIKGIDSNISSRK